MGVTALEVVEPVEQVAEVEPMVTERMVKCPVAEVEELIVEPQALVVPECV
jgi:hypothetical protein